MAGLYSKSDRYLNSLVKSSNKEHRSDAWYQKAKLADGENDFDRKYQFFSMSILNGGKLAYGPMLELLNQKGNDKYVLFWTTVALKFVKKDTFLFEKLTRIHDEKKLMFSEYDYKSIVSEANFVVNYINGKDVDLGFLSKKYQVSPPV